MAFRRGDSFMRFGGWGRPSNGRKRLRGPEQGCRFLLAASIGLVLSACVAPPQEDLDGLKALEAPFPAVARRTDPTVERSGSLFGRDEPIPIRASITVPRRPVQCVPYARQNSLIKIRGDARTWWQQAEGRYVRSNQPKIGAVLVTKPVRASRGHVAVVTGILNSREIVVDHANWLNLGQIHKGTPVRDVSRNNDWSLVRVWYTPGNRYGANRYPAYGFIEPPVTTAAR